MKDFPEEYEREKLDEMYAQAGLQEDQVSLLHDYFKAFSNFYQCISLRDAFDIFRRHNGDIISIEKFIAFSEVVRHEKEGRDDNYYFVLGEDELDDDVPDTKPIDRQIVSECLVVVDLDLYDRFISAAEGKPLYVPERDEFLKYADNIYYERIPQIEVMEDYLVNKAGLTKEKAEDMTDQCATIITCTIFPENIIYNIRTDRFLNNIKLTNFQREEFIRLAADVVNNTRHPCNRGFTPNEMAERYGISEKQTLASLSNDQRTFSRAEIGLSEYVPIGFILDGKVGRNDPCPCGSGKKYKKCCMRSGKHESD